MYKFLVIRKKLHRAHQHQQPECLDKDYTYI
jgi:hypothetical protein